MQCRKTQNQICVAHVGRSREAMGAGGQAAHTPRLLFVFGFWGGGPQNDPKIAHPTQKTKFWVPLKKKIGAREKKLVRPILTGIGQNRLKLAENWPE